MGLRQDVSSWVCCFVSAFDGYSDDRGAPSSSNVIVYRSYPGAGSRSLAFVVRRRFEPLVKQVRWQRRCGAIDFLQAGEGGRSGLNVWLVGLHGAHGELCTDVLADAAALVKARPRGSAVAVAGDINIDILPTLAGDPWAARPGRSEHHAAQRAHLASFCEALRLECIVPEIRRGIPGGAFSEECLFAPITRVPIGCAADTDLPSTIDYALANDGLIESSAIHWSHAIADHATVSFRGRLQWTQTEPRKANWACTDEGACVRWLQAQALSDDIDDICKMLKTMQDTWADRRRCAARRLDRIPFQARDAFARAAAATTEQAKRRWKALAWQSLKSAIETVRQRKLAEQVRAGRAVIKFCGLKKVKHLQHTTESGVLCVDAPDRCASMIEGFFKEKWGAERTQLRINVLNYVTRHEGALPPISSVELLRALACITKQRRLDKEGLSVAAFALLAQVNIDIVCRALQSFMSSTARMAQVCVGGHVFGKGTATPFVHQLRSITPLSALMKICDAVLSAKIHAVIDRVCPVPPGCYVAARPLTQPLDVVHGLQAVIEKGLDAEGKSCIMQADIEKYYDSLSPLQVVCWLEANGLEASVCAAALRHQLMPRIRLSACNAEAVIAARASGTITGSRTAGALGRVPVESTFRERWQHWQPHGFPCGRSHNLTACVYVDNLFVASVSFTGASFIMHDIEHQLLRVWGLQFKADSREAMLPRASPHAPLDGGLWSIKDSMKCLGHILQSNGSTSACWHQTRSAMWRAFYANCAATSSGKLSVANKMRLLRRCVVPGFDYRNTRWPPSRQLEKEVDAVHRKMIALILRTPKHPEEDVPSFVRRRGRLASVVADAHGKWSRQHHARVIAWAQHLERSRNQLSWAAALLHWRGRAWLARRRVDQGSVSAEAGRTRTRSAPGFVAVRWHDGLEWAKTRIAAGRSS